MSCARCNTVSTNGTQISWNDAADTQVVSVVSNDIIYLNNDTCNVELQCIDSIEEDPYNVLSVPETEFKEYKGNKYYTMFSDKLVVMFYKTNKKVVVSQTTVLTKEDMKKVLDRSIEYSKKFNLSNEIAEVSFNNKVSIKDLNNYIMMKDGITVGSNFRVYKNTDNLVTNKVVTVHGITLGKVSNGTSDFYLLDEIVMQVKSGGNLEDYIVFK